MIGLLHLVTFVLGSTQLTMTVTDHGVAANVGYLSFLVASSIVAGAYFEHSPRYPWLEAARAVVGAAIVSTGTWFGRSLDGMSAIMLGLVAASLVAVVVARARPGQSGKLQPDDGRAAADHDLAVCDVQARHAGEEGSQEAGSR